MISNDAATPDPLGEETPDAPGRRLLLKDRAYETLKRLVLSGEFPPGMFLSERQLAARLGMSKTPVRSAVERLDSEGFLAVSPQQGIVVTELSIEEVVDHYEIRLALETYTVRRLAGRLREDQIERLRQNLQEQHRCAERGDPDRYRALDADFHLLLCAFLGNQEFQRAMWRLRDKLHRVIHKVVSQQHERMFSSTQEHVEILEAMIEGTAELAARRVEKHLEWGQHFLLSRGPGGREPRSFIG